MKFRFLLILSLFVTRSVTGQHGVISTEYKTVEQAQAVQQWIENLYEVGVISANDTFTITEEARRVATDSVLRSIIYRPSYSWPETQYLLKNMQIKIGLWHLINLYEDNEANHEAVLKTVAGLGQVFDMEKALTAAFYTYIFFDPEAAEIIQGRPVIHRPDILDEKLSAVRSILELTHS